MRCLVIFFALLGATVAAPQISIGVPTVEGSYQRQQRQLGVSPYAQQLGVGVGQYPYQGQYPGLGQYSQQYPGQSGNYYAQQGLSPYTSVLGGQNYYYPGQGQQFAGGQYYPGQYSTSSLYPYNQGFPGQHYGSGYNPYQSPYSQQGLYSQQTGLGGLSGFGGTGLGQTGGFGLLRSGIYG